MDALSQIAVDPGVVAAEEELANLEREADKLRERERSLHEKAKTVPLAKLDAVETSLRGIEHVLSVIEKVRLPAAREKVAMAKADASRETERDIHTTAIREYAEAMRLASEMLEVLGRVEKANRNLIRIANGPTGRTDTRELRSLLERKLRYWESAKADNRRIQEALR